ncbi:glycosyltransferase family 2 protein [Acinetobacter sp. NIPH 2377]|uniref:glycosyltransferase family 2 protein n=1 Tax=Acinetobacter terrestris TaxID=2529843 RepID=UPI00148FBA6B|nr:glycosyltransferase family 2 protein [Acinetobacter terrestris]NNH34596.1 glycosyltransferase family 2 protein [Acinetobacter terrestris]
MKNYADVSVVIPYFNDSLYIEKALDSIFYQKVKPKEIIIVDDCSDDSDLLCNIIEENRRKNLINIVYIRNETNRNGAYSRNLGIIKSQYKFVAFLDADDYWSSEHLSISIKHMQNENLDFIFSNVIEVLEGCEKIRKVNDPRSLKNENDILFFSPPQTNSFLIKKSIFIQNGIFFDVNLKRHQDYQFLILCLNSDIKWSYLDVNTTYYRIPSKCKIRTVDYNSMLTFWNNNYSYFTEKYIKSYILGICVDYYFFQGKVNFLSAFNDKESIQFVLNDFLIKLMLKIEVRGEKVRLIFKFMHYFKNKRKYFLHKLIVG